jgi:hypothetical protein
MQYDGFHEKTGQKQIEVASGEQIEVASGEKL